MKKSETERLTLLLRDARQQSALNLVKAKPKPRDQRLQFGLFAATAATAGLALLLRIAQSSSNTPSKPTGP